jgi:guanine deaminase
MPNFMDIAIEEANKGVALGHGGPFGACIAKDGRLISIAHNRVLKYNDPTLHAEMQAISQAARALGRFDLSDCELYTSCEPCPMCLGAVYWARIKRVYYAATRDDAADGGFDDRKFYEDMGKGNLPEGVELIQIDRDKALVPFRRWNEKPDRKIY